MNNSDQMFLITIVGAVLADLIERDSDPTLIRMNKHLRMLFVRLGGDGDSEETNDDTS